MLLSVLHDLPAEPALDAQIGCVKVLGGDVVRRLRRSFLYPGPLDSPEFQQMGRRAIRGPGKKLSRTTRQAVIGFSKHFYRKVYPPNPQDAASPFDLSDAAFLRDDMKAAGALARTRGSAPHNIFLARAEIGLYEGRSQTRRRMVPSSRDEKAGASSRAARGRFRGRPHGMDPVKDS